MAELKQSTARVRVFKMIDSQDHFSKKTGLTCTVNLSKNGAAFGAAAGVVAEVANGWYSVSLTTVDTNTLGDIAYYITATGADDTDFVDQITTQILGDTLTANATQLAGQTITAAAGVTFPSSVASPTNITAGTITTTTNLTNLPAITANWLTAAGTAADFGTELATAIWTDTVAGDFTAALSVGKSVMNGVALGTGLTINAYTGNTAQTGDSFARIGIAGAGLTNIDLPNQTMDIIGSITGNLSGSVGSVTGAVGSVTGAVGSVTGAVGSVTGAVGSVTGAVGSVTGNVGGNVTGSVGSVAAAGIAANSLATAAKQDIADFVLDRNMTTGTDSGTDTTAVRTPRQALRVLRNKTTITAGTATITKEDDLTASWTAAITTAAGNPISGVDPT